ncbi:MAG TPA: type II CAAX endopeptidase family protein [Microlunatus sp.]|jgi:membrane protease YdiL (CAAX protease family)|nr:type II CAAX endopeptidase family protein [Microlunatus sp.]
MITEKRAAGPLGLRAAVRRHPAGVFVLLAFVLTWSVWIPRALVSRGLLTHRWPMILGEYWVWLPALAAVITAALAGQGALVELGARLLRWRVRWWWYPMVLLGPGAYWGVIYLAAVPAGWSDHLRQPLPLSQGLTAALPLLLVLCLTDGLGEETGWRGFLLPRQLEHLSRFAASCLVGVVWALWHLPLFWTEGAVLAGSSPLVMLVELPAVSIIFTWVFEHTRGSALIAILLHAAMNWWAFSAVGGGLEFWPLTILLVATKWLLAAVIALSWIRRPRPSSPTPPSHHQGRRSSTCPPAQDATPTDEPMTQEAR